MRRLACSLSAILGSSLLLIGCGPDVAKVTPIDSSWRDTSHDTSAGYQSVDFQVDVQTKCKIEFFQVSETHQGAPSKEAMQGILTFVDPGSNKLAFVAGMSGEDEEYPEVPVRLVLARAGQQDLNTDRSLISAAGMNETKGRSFHFEAADLSALGELELGKGEYDVATVSIACVNPALLPADTSFEVDHATMTPTIAGQVVPQEDYAKYGYVFLKAKVTMKISEHKDS